MHRRENVAELEGDERFAFVTGDESAAMAIRADLYLHLASPTSLLHYHARSQETIWANPRGADDLERRPEITRVRERYGWQPRLPLDAGMRRTIAYLRAAPAPAGARA